MLGDGLPRLQDQARDDRENIRPADRSNSDDNQLLSEDSSKINGKPIGFYCNYSTDYSLLSLPATC